MISVFLVAAIQTSDPSDAQLDRYLDACQSQYERAQASEDWFRTGMVPLGPAPFWESLPSAERRIAQSICSAWLLGLRYQLGQTVIRSTR